jgi:hypothetical protein
MKLSRSVFVVAVVAVGLVTGNGFGFAEENSQSSSANQLNNGSTGMQKGKMGETERAIPQTDQSSQSGKMSAPSGPGK